MQDIDTTDEEILSLFQHATVQLDRIKGESKIEKKMVHLLVKRRVSNKIKIDTNGSSFYCNFCFAYVKTECICDRITGYDPETGVPIVDVTDSEWHYLYGSR